MADKRLIDNESSTTVDKFYGNNGGKDVQIPLADAAAVLAAKLPFGNLFGSGTAQGLTSLNDINENSIKYASKSYNISDMPYDYCMVLTFVNGDYGMQIAVSVDQNKMAYRAKVGGVWNQWVRL